MGSDRAGSPRVWLGCEALVDAPEVWGRFGSRIGLLTNDGARVGSVDANPGPPSRVAFMEAGLPITRLFEPEHGILASAPDGVPVHGEGDPATGLPVTSLYGSRLQPDREILEKLDLVLVDLPDVGARFYTFLWTLTLLMEACSGTGVPMVVLDRPNPVGGLEAWVEGPLPDSDAPPTFLGRWPIPIRHSLTLGEMALLIRGEMDLKLELDVIPMEGWGRAMRWRDTGLPFHPPSPGIPSPESALLYPGLALLEATNVSEGRGTDMAFRWLGAPWMEEGVGTTGLAEAINRSEPGGVRAHPRELTVPGVGVAPEIGVAPEMGKASEMSEVCPGIAFEVTDPSEVRPVALGLQVLSLLPTLWPGRFSWTPYPTAVNPSGTGHLLRLLARRGLVETLEKGHEVLDRDTAKEWTKAPGWWARAAPYLIYG